jgi:cyclic beta-1,2-glucan synthetase
MWIAPASRWRPDFSWPPCSRPNWFWPCRSWRLAGRSPGSPGGSASPLNPRRRTLTAEQLAFLRRTARKTWHFFETFVTAQENWLPPDNFQEVPARRSPSRTSPTNMGLALLANLAARDLGYLSAGGLIRRTQDTLATMQRLERYRGHFYNWYETRTLQPLLPLYVSSVDSGNLAGHLLTLGAGLREQADEKIFTPADFCRSARHGGDSQGFGPRKSRAGKLDANWNNRLPACARRLPCWKGRRPGDRDRRSLAGESEELKGWAQTLKRNCEEHLEDLLFLAPWLALPTPVRQPPFRRQ